MGVKTIPLQRCLEFVVEKELVFNEDVVLKEIRKMDEETSNDIFCNVYIPQRLDQVVDPEVEVMEIEYGDYSNAELHGAYTGVITSELAPYEGDLLDDEIEFMEEEDEYADDELDFYNVDLTKIVQLQTDEKEKNASKNSFKNDKCVQDKLDEHCEENNDNNDGDFEEEDDEKNILKQSFDRKKFSNEEWKKIQMRLKIARREKRKTKTSKVIKRKNYRKSHPNAK